MSDGNTISIFGLLIPADPGQPCGLIRFPATTEGIYRVLGGHDFDEAFQGAVPDGLFACYAPDTQIDLPDNQRAGVLAVRLGYSSRVIRRRLRGHVLAVGLDAETAMREVDVPRGVIDAAVAEHLMTTGLDASIHPTR